MILGFLLGISIGMLLLIIYKHYANNFLIDYISYKRTVALIENSKDIIYYYQLSPTKKFKYISPSVSKSLGYTVEDCYKHPQNIIKNIHPDCADTLNKKINGTLDFSKPILMCWKSASGDYTWFEEFVTPIYQNSNLIAIQGILRNINDKISLQRELEYRANHDCLTSLYNRDFFENLIKRYNLEIDISIGIILCDLDNLKITNDTLGHKAGDNVIIEVSKIFKNLSSNNIFPCRIGGDEFAIITINMEEAHIKHVLNKILYKIREFNSYQSSVRIQASFGYACCNSSLNNMDNLFREADTNMYNIKRKMKLV